MVIRILVHPYLNLNCLKALSESVSLSSYCRTYLKLKISLLFEMYSFCNCLFEFYSGKDVKEKHFLRFNNISINPPIPRCYAAKRKRESKNVGEYEH